ncbi:helix-turn-helix transcriptional regulator [Streptomyces sp. SID12501]|uniref:Helix-turn-helix transcriptional regulator n=1 Tax=Streptomyces sp. SID12501 TaxID=2706042 RepID=A0A6B3BM10_9ACTN|nr:helix-turn-helix transcriptional regulator [Streptomyces sp. SID12501]NEC84726.1 helix-turn-helix transcriptional regulator [Streptomyces sp. SID12501]
MRADLGFLGVGTDVERVYRALLRVGRALPGELAEQCGYQEEQARSVCRRLVELELANSQGDGVLTPLSPARAVEGLVATAVTRLELSLQSEVHTSGIVDALIAERRAPSPGGQPGAGRSVHLAGMAAVRAAIDELTFFTRDESLTTNPTGVLSQESISHARPIDERVLRRGVRMRTVVGHAAREDPPTMAYLRELAGKGAWIRIAHDPIERLIICDRAAALTPLDPVHTAKGAILTHEPGLVAALVSLFERMWTGAEPLPMVEGEDAGGAAGPVNELERKVLHSLCTADKDEVGAREVGIALRTYRKHVAALMRRLDASNRFQAALLAREKGWI